MRDCGYNSFQVSGVGCQVSAGCQIDHRLTISGFSIYIIEITSCLHIIYAIARLNI